MYDGGADTKTHVEPALKTAGISETSFLRVVHNINFPFLRKSTVFNIHKIECHYGYSDRRIQAPQCRPNTLLYTTGRYH